MTYYDYNPPQVEMNGKAAACFIFAFLVVPVAFLASLGVTLWALISSPYQWDLGVMIGLPAVVFVFYLLLFFAAFLLALRLDDPDDWDAGLKLGFSIGCFVLIPVLLGVVAFGYWPWQAEYHQYRPVHGTVANISSRFVGGDSTSQKFVVTLTSGQQQYGITDTRAALLKPGDAVSLRCIRVYEYGSNDAGYDCKWGQ